MTNPSVFISYSTKDQDAALFIHKELTKRGVDVFVDFDQLHAGDSLHGKFAKEIRTRDVVLFLVSENSVNSKWVMDEIRWARVQEKRIVPLALDSVEIPDELFFVGLIRRDPFDRSEAGIRRLCSSLGIAFENTQAVTETPLYSQVKPIAPQAQENEATGGARKSHSAYIERLLSELRQAGIRTLISAEKHVHIRADLGNGVVIPIAVRGSARTGFSLSKVYADIPNLVIAYVWGMEDGYDKVTYALTYEEAFPVIEKYTQSRSWVETGEYAMSKVAPTVVSYLEQFQITPENWRTKLQAVAANFQEEMSDQTDVEPDYFAAHGESAVRQFMLHVDELKRLVSQKHWELEPKFNKNWCSFKYGGRNVFGVAWGNRDRIFLFAKISPEEMRAAGIGDVEYKAQWNEAYYTLSAGIQLPDKYLPILEMAYKNVVG